MSKYQPNGTPLTDYERELLVILMEECAEVIQAASKLIRFGKENRPPTGFPHSEISNSTYLGLEAGDLDYMIRLVREAGIISLKDIGAGHQRKMARLDQYMQHSKGS
jgi:hypothetical protein